jgi:N-acetylglucosamine-6-phosphate deacetylase
MEIPGFVDIQVNGYLGHDFNGRELTAESFAEACRKVLATGTAALLPTVSTAPMAIYERNLPFMAEVLQAEEFRGRVLGIHLEGPFLCPEPGARGAHNPEWMRPGDLDLLKRLLDLAGGQTRVLTVAPEAEGAEKLARYAVDRGIAVSVSHTLAGADDLARMVDAGATFFTHLGNGLPNRIHRHHNPIWAALANDDLAITIITDGHHLPPSAIKTMIRAKGVAKTAVVSDASHLAGLPPGRYSTPDNEVILLEPSGKLHNPQKECLVGSSATMMQCMNHLASLGILTAEELLAVGFHNPLRLIAAKPADLRAEGAIHYDEEARAFSC